MAGIRWDAQALKDRMRSLDGIRVGAFRPRLAQLFAVGAVKLTMDTFRDQKDPYGPPWKPLAQERPRDRRARIRAMRAGRKVRGQKILIRTGRMRNSTAPIARGTVGGVGIPVTYAIVHQHGAVIKPHQVAASHGSPTYRVGGKFVSEAKAGKARTKGLQVSVARYSRTYANAIVIPQRRMLPEPNRGLPMQWQRMLNRESTGLLKRWIEKGARA